MADRPTPHKREPTIDHQEHPRHHGHEEQSPVEEVQGRLRDRTEHAQPAAPAYTASGY